MSASAHTFTPMAQVQQALTDSILHGQHDEAARLVRPHGALTNTQRLDIYHQAYRWRLLEVMQDHYAQTHAYLGDELFDTEALAYIEAHPPEADNLRHYGAHWPDWLAQRYPQDLDMADLARLEWALRHAFDAANAPSLTWPQLASLPPEAWQTVRFDLAPGTQVLRLSHNVTPLWQALSQGGTPEPVQPLVHDVLVWRQGWQPHFRSTSPEEAEAIRLMLAGQPFDHACQQALAFTQTPRDEVAISQTAMQWLQQWMAEQLLARHHT